MAEFTGERVIPELVDADLFNEHMARYRFAKHFMAGLSRPMRVLDAGCGSGYGSAELSDVDVSVTGTDISAEAVEHASQRYGNGNVGFQEAACEALPFAPATFDLMTAFEVIEHLDRWQELLSEASRVLKATGVLLVSTPNRDYYAESRGDAGPNPFHRHEFDYEEFRQALGAVFPHVRIWTQNHAGAIVFAPAGADKSVLDAGKSNDPAGAHFYLAACSQSPIAAHHVFAWVPSSANVLRERERHIAKLTGELAQKDAWLRQTLDAHSELQRDHEAVIAELERQNNWAEELNLELAAKNTRIDELQNEVASRLVWISDLESQIEGAKAQIGRVHVEIELFRADRERLLAEMEQFHAEIQRLQTEEERLRREAVERHREAQGVIDRLEATVAERTLWAERLNGEIADYRGELQRIGASPWFRAGAKLGVGPRLPDSQPREGQ